LRYAGRIPTTDLLGCELWQYGSMECHVLVRSLVEFRQGLIPAEVGVDGFAFMVVDRPGGQVVLGYAEGRFDLM
jgi:hypothetical protein